MTGGLGRRPARTPHHLTGFYGYAGSGESSSPSIRSMAKTFPDRGSDEGLVGCTFEPDRHRQQTLNLAAKRERTTQPVLSGGSSAPGYKR
jgi:hypothetical protein